MSLHTLVNINGSVIQGSSDESKNSDKKLVFPYVIRTIDPKLNDQLLRDFKGSRDPFLQVGPKNYVFPNSYAKEAEDMYNFNVRSDDVFVMTFPRSVSFLLLKGTTMVQELVWLLCNDLDYAKAAKISLWTRFPFFELSSRINEKVKAEMMTELIKHDPQKHQWWANMKPVWKTSASIEGKRFFKTHLPFSLLPPALTNGHCKVIYVARSPLDVAVSCFYNSCSLRLHSYQNDFRTYWNYFINDMVVCTPYWEHVKEAWKKRHDDNFLFLFYENITTNMSEELEKISAFLGKSYTKDELDQLKNHLNIENFRKNPSVSLANMREIFEPGKLEGLVRRGVIGGYKSYFDEEMLEEAQRWISDNLRDTDLRFPVLL